MNWLLTTCAAPKISPVFTDEKRPPLGIGFLISILRKAGHRVSLIDNYLSPTDFLETDYLIRNKIDFVGISVNTICSRDFMRMAHKLQKIREKGIWKGKIVVGGPHASVMPESIPDFVDHIVIGEGERAVLEIADGGTERILRSSLVEDLDSLPPPSWEDFMTLPYDWSVEWFEARPVFTMNTSRGCPFNCRFCSSSSIWGCRYRYFSAELLVSHIKYLVKEYGCRGIYFREDNFTVNRSRVEEFCDRLLRVGLSIQWACETRVDTLNRDLIKTMHQAGCRAFYIGVESGSQRLLDFMNKGITLEQIESVFAWCNEIGMRTYASFIVGVPTETPTDRQMSRTLCWRIKPTTYAFNVFVGIPKSELYYYVLANRLYGYIDDRGLVYLKEHDSLVNEFYGGDERRKTPRPSQEHYALGQDLLRSGDRLGAFREGIQAVLLSPFQKKYWRLLAVSFLPRSILIILKRVIIGFASGSRS